MSATTPEAPAVEAVGVDKSFGITRALRGVNLQIANGQCVGLVGRNGAGKSTLVSILSGLLAPDAGLVRFDGQPAPALKDMDLWRSRIAVVFQHSMVVPQLTVAENVFLGHRDARGGFIDWKSLRERTQAILDEWGFDISAKAPCSALRVEERQVVEIARALATGARCLLLDEPTAALERGAIVRLFSRVRQLVANGFAVLYISHHLEEVFEICQEVTVLRDGQAVLSAPVASLTKDEMVRAMVGGVTPEEQAEVPVRVTVQTAGDEAGLTVEDLYAESQRGALRGVSLHISPGEQVGVTGLLSAGVVTLGRAVAGVEPWSSGRVLIDGKPLAPGRRDLALKAGAGYVPEDRMAEGFVAHLSVAENVTMTVLDELAPHTGIVTPARKEAAAKPYTEALSVVSSSLRQAVAELSGGNQQKVAVARALIRKPAVIVAITPTRGVDVASKALLLRALSVAARNQGAALLLATDDLSDLVLCDRIVVLVRGEKFTEFAHPPFDREALLAATEGLAGTEGLATVEGLATREGLAAVEQA
ncbi:MAG TPA: sugar ABC transporter ATP-binding protein [Acidimicrobiales bacterium]|nr:sugar ABC transporter ATP-binding protein [Acidimicrobiales bacterium]